MTQTANILDVEIHKLTRQQLLAGLNQGVYFTPNVDFIMKMQHDAEFKAAFHQADFRICDSRIVLMASRFLNDPLPECIPGSDFFGEYCQYHREHPEITVFLLGAMPGVAEQAMHRLNARLGRNMVVAAHSPSFGFEKNPAECESIIAMVNASKATVLAVGVGAPKQEKWIMQWRQQMPAVRVFMGIGATIDFEAGNIPRAPVWMNRVGLEWAFRLLREPKRLWRRYMVDDLPFFWLLLKQKLGLRRGR